MRIRFSIPVYCTMPIVASVERLYVIVNHSRPPQLSLQRLALAGCLLLAELFLLVPLFRRFITISGISEKVCSKRKRFQ